MVAGTSSSPPVRVSQIDGWVCVAVPYEHAEQWQRYFRARRIGSTLIRDPVTREARLDLWKRWGCGPVG
jgi:hypothetical protein